MYATFAASWAGKVTTNPEVLHMILKTLLLSPQVPFHPPGYILPLASLALLTSTDWVTWLPEKDGPGFSILCFLLCQKSNFAKVCSDSSNEKTNYTTAGKHIVGGGGRCWLWTFPLPSRRQCHTNPNVYLGPTSFRDSGKKSQAHHFVVLRYLPLLFCFCLKRTQKEAHKVIFQRQSWQKSRAGLWKGNQT